MDMGTMHHMPEMQHENNHSSMGKMDHGSHSMQDGYASHSLRFYFLKFSPFMPVTPLFFIVGFVKSHENQRGNLVTC
ncbi:MAG: hypothetical protein GQ559_12835 [Desulfobulbaceae bacterium]|nr:hypothetical protein [Desulfobulbaceae bacterium]